MRQIKFRGWDIERNEWVYGYFYTFGVRGFIIEPGKPGIPEQHIAVDERSVCQFTGLHDKNGKEIYERDIGRWVNKHGHVLYERGMVAWHRGGLWFCKDIEGEDAIGVAHEQWEVIGNIYENSDLLK